MTLTQQHAHLSQGAHIDAHPFGLQLSRCIIPTVFPTPGGKPYTEPLEEVRHISHDAHNLEW